VNKFEINLINNKYSQKIKIKIRFLNDLKIFEIYFFGGKNMKILK
jgi:hypothetical protein